MQNARTGGDFCISIHALREEGDNPIRRKQRRPFPISIHALREEGDAVSVLPQPISKRFLSTPSGRVYQNSFVIFLSTPSVRRATRENSRATTGGKFSIHALREEGARRRPRQRPVGGISIHALREEGDRAKIQPVVLDLLFLSTPSARRAT